jgi:hypothetical protein
MKTLKPLKRTYTPLDTTYKKVSAQAAKRPLVTVTHSTWMFTYACPAGRNRLYVLPDEGAASLMFMAPSFTHPDNSHHPMFKFIRKLFGKSEPSEHAVHNIEEAHVIVTLEDGTTEKITRHGYMFDLFDLFDDVYVNAGSARLREYLDEAEGFIRVDSGVCVPVCRVKSISRVVVEPLLMTYPQYKEKYGK